MSLPRVVHLVDDTTAGGVMRVLDHILTAPEMAQFADHSAVRLDRGRLSPGHIKSDIIVSHLAVSWRAMPMLVALRARHPRTPLVHVEHSYTEAFVTANVTHKRRFATLLRMTYQLFDRVVAVSAAQGEWLVRSGAVPAVTVIPSCVDLSSFRALGPARAPAQVIGAIGRLDRQKGFDTLIAAFRRLSAPDIALHIYGEGSEGAALRALAGQDPRIRFMGFAPDPVSAMAAVDVVAMPSNWEAYGLVAIEALAAGRSLLVNEVDGLLDHLANGAHGVSGTSVDAWHVALQRIMQPGSDRTEATIGTNRRQEQAFSDEWHHIITQLLAKRA